MRDKNSCFCCLSCLTSSDTAIGTQTYAARHMAVSSSCVLVLHADETAARIPRVALGRPAACPPLSMCRESALALVVVLR